MIQRRNDCAVAVDKHPSGPVEDRYRLIGPQWFGAGSADDAQGGERGSRHHKARHQKDGAERSGWRRCQQRDRSEPADDQRYDAKHKRQHRQWPRAAVNHQHQRSLFGHYRAANLGDQPRLKWTVHPRSVSRSIERERAQMPWMAAPV